MRRTLAIVFAAALVGGAAGAAVGIAVDGGRSSPSVPAEAPVAARPASVVRAGAALSPEAVYRRDSPAVVVIKDTVTQVVPPTFFTPGGKEQVGALGSGFVVDREATSSRTTTSSRARTDIRVGFTAAALPRHPRRSRSDDGHRRRPREDTGVRPPPADVRRLRRHPGRRPACTRSGTRSGSSGR